MRLRSFSHMIIVAFILWFGSYAYLYFYPVTGVKPLYSYFALLGFFVFWLASVSELKVTRDQGVLALLVWLGLYLVYGCLTFLNSTQDAIATQTFVTLVESIALCAAFVLIFAGQTSLRRIQATLALLAVIATAVNVYDFLDPVFTKVPGRAAGLYVNPNIAGHFIAMAMVAGIEIIPRRWRLPFVLVCGAGVLLTFSRSGWILWGVGVVWLGWQRYIGTGRNRVLALVLGALIGIGFVGLLFTGGLGKMVAGSPVAAYLDANTKARLGIGASSLSGFAAHERKSLVFDSLRIGSEAPLLGHGLGYTAQWQYRAGPHNMYLLFFVEGGLPGMLLYLALMVLLWRYSMGVGRIIALQLIIVGVFTHNQLERPAFLMLMAFVMAHRAVARRGHGARLRNQTIRPS